MIVLLRHISGTVEVKLLYIHRFPLFRPHFLAEAEKFNLRYPDPSQIESVSDKLRWYRYSRGLLQREVADYVGIDRGTYLHYEEAERDYYPSDKMQAIAELYGIEVECLLDEYNLFLYNDQGKQIRARREAMEMTVAQYADHLSIDAGKLRKWEGNKIRVSKRTWEKLFRE